MTDDFQIRDTRKPRHFWADNEIVDEFLPAIGVYGFAVYMILCRHSAAGVCKPSIPHIAETLNISVTTVKRAIKTLNDADLIKIRRRAPSRKGKLNDTNIYYIVDVKTLLDGAISTSAQGGGSLQDGGVGRTGTPYNTNTQYKDSFQPPSSAGEGQQEKAEEPSTPPANPSPLQPKKDRAVGRKPNLLMNAVATFCFKCETQEEINANAARIGKSEVLKDFDKYLHDIYKIAEGEPIPDDKLKTVADAVIDGTNGLANMSTWWDENHKDAAGKPLNRPNPLKFMSAFIDFVKWRREKKDAPKIVRKNGDEFYDERGNWMKMEDDKLWRYSGGWKEVS